MVMTMSYTNQRRFIQKFRGATWNQENFQWVTESLEERKVAQTGKLPLIARTDEDQVQGLADFTADQQLSLSHILAQQRGIQ